MDQPLNSDFGQGIYIQRCRFDFFQIAQAHLLEKADHHMFLKYCDLYRTLGQRYCFNRETSKALLRAMKENKLIAMEKRGVKVIGGHHA